MAARGGPKAPAKAPATAAAVAERGPAPEARRALEGPVHAVTSEASSSSGLPDSSSAGCVCPSKTVRLPAPVKTGNKKADDLLRTQFTCLVTTVEDLIADEELVMSTFNHVQKEKRKLLGRRHLAPDADAFSDLVSIASMPEDFKIGFVVDKEMIVYSVLGISR